MISKTYIVILNKYLTKPILLNNRSALLTMQFGLILTLATLLILTDLLPVWNDFNSFLVFPLCTITRGKVTKLSIRTQLALFSRSMFTRSSTPKIINHLAYTPKVTMNSTQYLRNTNRLTSPHDQDVKHVDTRYMASYSINTPSPFASAQQLKNNPIIKKKNKNIVHDELVKHECNEPGCDGKFCKGFCSLPTRRRAMGHGSHGKPPANEPDKKAILVSKVDFSGKAIDQNIVMYDTPHETTVTGENKKATDMINNDPLIQEIIQ
jgi:hypothetical protein